MKRLKASRSACSPILLYTHDARLSVTAFGNAAEQHHVVQSVTEGTRACAGTPGGPYGYVSGQPHISARRALEMATADPLRSSVEPAIAGLVDVATSAQAAPDPRSDAEAVNVLTTLLAEWPRDHARRQQLSIEHLGRRRTIGLSGECTFATRQDSINVLVRGRSTEHNRPFAIRRSYPHARGIDAADIAAEITRQAAIADLPATTRLSAPLVLEPQATVQLLRFLWAVAVGSPPLISARIQCQVPVCIVDPPESALRNGDRVDDLGTPLRQLVLLEEGLWLPDAVTAEGLFAEAGRMFARSYQHDAHPTPIGLRVGLSHPGAFQSGQPAGQQGHVHRLTGLDPTGKQPTDKLQLLAYGWNSRDGAPTHRVEGASLNLSINDVLERLIAVGQTPAHLPLSGGRYNAATMTLDVAR